jgi:xylan 1,4-beta-xylosidase
MEIMPAASVLNSTGDVFKLYGEHVGAGAIPLTVDGNSPQPEPKYPVGFDHPKDRAGSPAYPLDVIAGPSQDRGPLRIAVTNATLKPQTLSIKLEGLKARGNSQVWPLTGKRIEAANKVGQPSGVTVHESRVPPPSARLPQPSIYEFLAAKNAMKALIALLCAVTTVYASASPVATFPVIVKIDAARPVGALSPIWRFFGADEPNYATRPDGEKLLMELGRLRRNQVYFRAHNLMTSGDGTPDFKWGSTNLYTEKEGKPIYDFTLVDHIIDTYLARGLHPYLEIGFMPETMTSAPAGVPYHRPWRAGADNRGTSGWSYPPRDYDKWAELVYQWVRHSVERYGQKEVQRWYFEVWNEPNLDFYWQGTAEDFYRLHDYAVDAVRRALPSARVGGPDVAGSGGALMDGFLRHISTGTNYATGKMGTPTDFLSFHAKGQPVVADGHVRMGISAQLKTVDEAFAKIAAVPELAHKPVVIGENDPEGCAACPGPQNAYRNGTLYSSYTAATYARLWELARLRDVNLQGALTWAFTFVDQPWFAGYRQLATNGIDLPVLNVFRLFERLGSTQVEASSSAEVSLRRIESDGVRGAPDVGVLATRATDGRVDVLLWHYQDDDVPGPEAQVHLLVVGLVPSRQLQARAWRIDSANGNAFTAWKSMGSPSRPTRRQIEQLQQASRMRERPITLGPRLNDGSVTAETSLPLQGVELIEVTGS